MVLAPIRRLRFMRDHRWVPGRLSDYLAGELGPPGVARIERHLAVCPQCLAALRGLKRTLAALARVASTAVAEPVPDIATAVRQRLHEPPPDDRASTPPG
jgi:anti-sigma factor RsiW